MRSIMVKSPWKITTEAPLGDTKPLGTGHFHVGIEINGWEVQSVLYGAPGSYLGYIGYCKQWKAHRLDAYIIMLGEGI